jgi:hypothetical protein
MRKLVLTPWRIIQGLRLPRMRDVVDKREVSFLRSERGEHRLAEMLLASTLGGMPYRKVVSWARHHLGLVISTAWVGRVVEAAAERIESRRQQRFRARQFEALVLDAVWVRYRRSPRRAGRSPRLRRDNVWPVSVDWRVRKDVVGSVAAEANSVRPLTPNPLGHPIVIAVKKCPKTAADDVAGSELIRQPKPWRKIIKARINNIAAGIRPLTCDEILSCPYVRPHFQVEPTFPLSSAHVNLRSVAVINIHAGVSTTKTLRRSEPDG